MNAVYDYTLVQEINLIGVGDDDEEEEEQEQGECDEEDKDQRKANVWPKEYHESEIKKSIINRLQTSSRLHRSNSSPEERTLRSNGYSSNIQYQSRSPVLLRVNTNITTTARRSEPSLEQDVKKRKLGQEEGNRKQSIIRSSVIRTNKLGFLTSALLS